MDWLPLEKELTTQVGALDQELNSRPCGVWANALTTGPQQKTLICIFKESLDFVLRINSRIRALARVVRPAGHCRDGQQ